MITLWSIALILFVIGAILSFAWAASLAIKKPTKKVSSLTDEEDAKDVDIAGQVIRRLGVRNEKS